MNKCKNCFCELGTGDTNGLCFACTITQNSMTKANIKFFRSSMTKTQIIINGIEQMITELNEKYSFPNLWSAEIIRKYLEELKEKSIDNAE